MSSFWLFFLPFLYFKYHPYNTTINFSQQSNLFSYLSICFENWKKWMLVHRGPVVVVRRLQLPHPFWESPPVRLGWIELGAAASLLPTFLASYYYSTVHTLQWRRHRRRNAAATVPSATTTTLVRRRCRSRFSRQAQDGEQLEKAVLPQFFLQLHQD